MRKRFSTFILPLALAILSPMNSFAGTDSESSLYRLVMDSVNCSESPAFLSTLSLTLRAQGSLTFDQAVKNSKSAVHHWCVLQMGDDQLSEDLHYCETEYQAQMDRYLVGVFMPDQGVDPTSVFNVTDKIVAPDCKLSPIDKEHVRQLAIDMPSPRALPVRSADTNWIQPTRAASEDVAIVPLSSESSKLHSGSTVVVPKAAPAQDPAPAIAVQTLLTEDASQKRTDTFLHSISDYVGAGLKGNSCPLAKEIAVQLSRGELMQKNRCSSPAPYNQNVLSEIVHIQQDLKTMQATAPDDSVISENRGGGYNMNGGGLNVPIMAGDKTLFKGTPNSTSFCSAALFTVFTRTVGRIDNGAIFKNMTPSQLENFTVHGEDDYGAYGAINNNGNGILDLNDRMGQYAFGVDVNKLPREKCVGDRQKCFDYRDTFENACAGDMMQWDRKDAVTGHSGVFLKKVDGKVYFWSSNASTAGYGVTCEAADNMIPKIVRMTKPENIAAMPEYHKQKNLAGDFEVASLGSTVKEINQDLAPATSGANARASAQTVKPFVAPVMTDMSVSAQLTPALSAQ